MPKQLLYTREEALSDKQGALLAENNILVQQISVIQTVGLEYYLPTKKYDWVFFTSANLVKYFDLSQLSPLPKVAAIGEKTAQAVRTAGFPVTFVSQKSVGEAFVTEWLEYLRQTASMDAAAFSQLSVLLPQSKIARPVLQEQLSAAGCQVTRLAVYDTIFPEKQRVKLLAEIEAQSFDYVVFASPSAWDNFFHVFQQSRFKDQQQKYFTKIKIGSIGAITSAAIEKSGAVVTFEPQDYNMDALFEVMMQEME